jgi:hypothetical protein
MMKTAQGWYAGVVGLGLLLSGRETWADQPRPPSGESETSRDAWLEKQVEKLIEKDVTLKAQGLDVTVVESKVTLTGTTGSEKEKREAERLARSVDGVTELDNQILVRGSPEAARPAGDRGKRVKPRESKPAPPGRPRSTNSNPVPPSSPIDGGQSPGR